MKSVIRDMFSASSVSPVWKFHCRECPAAVNLMLTQSGNSLFVNAAIIRLPTRPCLPFLPGNAHVPAIGREPRGYCRVIFMICLFRPVLSKGSCSSGGCAGRLRRHRPGPGTDSVAL